MPELGEVSYSYVTCDDPGEVSYSYVTCDDPGEVSYSYVTCDDPGMKTAQLFEREFKGGQSAFALVDARRYIRSYSGTADEIHFYRCNKTFFCL